MPFGRGFVFGMDIFLLAQGGMCVCVCGGVVWGEGVGS